MEIRKARLCELSEIQKVFEIGRNFMRQNGNKNQWINGYPQDEVLVDDINNDNLYVCVENGEIAGVFAFIIGKDPTYSYIEGGDWLDDGNYGTVHRIASSGKYRGIAKICFDFCKSKIDNVRCDTHHDNAFMQKKLQENGFEKCGVIYIADGSPRIAYNFVK